MLLRHWFRKHASLPLALALATILMGSGALAWNHLRAVRNVQETSLEQVASLGALSLAQRNRPLLEAALDATRWQLGSTYAALCHGGQAVASSGIQETSCGQPSR
ncbi:MAG TPA: hypothetical protein VL588_12870, partial [Bdellovibrionota bacterium]|nr:hypothetical protein [Bdellovibrionota bacterium]